MLFLPDQHLGRNTAVLELGLILDDCVLYDPHKPGGGLTASELRDAKMILWRGHCSVHGRFTPERVDDGARAGARGQRAGAPGVPARGGHRRRLGRLDRVHHQDRRGGPGRLGLGDRHRAEPGPPAGDAHIPDKQIMFLEQDGLLLLDDEPDRPAAPGLGAGGAASPGGCSTRSAVRPGPRAQPRPGRAGPDAGPAVDSHGYERHVRCGTSCVVSGAFRARASARYAAARCQLRSRARPRRLR